MRDLERVAVALERLVALLEGAPRMVDVVGVWPVVHLGDGSVLSAGEHKQVSEAVAAVLVDRGQAAVVMAWQ